jgi:2-polyprenyl-6-methoxyphenol hydroxylase-like FAD-dependent oxidoreductase
MMPATDVFVIGGGPAGLAAAIAARRKGLTVALADGAHPPIDKACGEGLMPDGLGALRSLGVHLDAADGHPFHGIRFLGAGVSAEGRFPEGYALGVRRTVLHSRMVEAAAAADVRMMWATPVSGICAEGVRINNETVPARWIIGADGFNSRVRRWIALDPGTPRNRFGFRMHYRVPPWSGCMELHWGAGCQIYVTPVGPQEVCAAVISRDSHLRLEEALAQFPELAARLAGASRVTAELGAVTRNCRLERVYRGRVALLGDASGAVDAITGEGLCLAFQQAVALADSLAAGTLAPYQAAHRRLAQRPMRMARLMLAMDRCGWLRDLTLSVLAAEPRLLRKILSLHVSSSPDYTEGAAACVPNRS